MAVRSGLEGSNEAAQSRRIPPRWKVTNIVTDSRELWADISGAPFLTADLPGVGGQLKREPEDFVVEEIPAYEPCGRGPFCFLWIEKRDLSSEQLLDLLSERLEIPRSAVGLAGMKDRRAVTRQWVSIPEVDQGRLAGLEGDPRLVVLRVSRHTNKLKTGHLRGNRFIVRLRDVVPDAASRAAAIARHIAQAGFPNYFGTQRFGAGGRTLALGRDLLQGRISEQRLSPRRRRFLLRLALSAVQSWLFNGCLIERIRTGTIRRVLPGDVLQVRRSGGLFVAQDVAREQRRFESGVIVPTGPMFGPRMKRPHGRPERMEQQVLDVAGIDRRAFEMYPGLTSGARRPYLVFPEAVETRAEGNDLVLRFTLPRGTYATVLLREFQKTAGAGPVSEPDDRDASCAVEPTDDAEAVPDASAVESRKGRE
ncbi:MAG: tRNA pseudouridine(13) synthase TruD [Planctomycetota bacterium]|nr:MAG: tRNA pseudouridine(13) synthase TruD [Planctomycetota bacterium]